MATYQCAATALQTGTVCGSAGITAVYIALDSDIDWAAVTVASDEISAWAFTGVTKFVKLEPERKPSKLDAEYTRDNSYYEVNLNDLTFMGKSTAQSLALANLKECCSIIAVVYLSDGSSRVIGKELINGSFVNPVAKAKVVRHLDSAGEFGGGAENGARDVIDIQCQHQQPMLFTSIDMATMDSTYV